MFRQYFTRLLLVLALIFLGLLGNQSQLLASASNDDYPGTPISGLPGTTTGTTIGATSQSGEYYYGNGSTVWYRWTAPGSGGVTFSTTGADFDNVVTVYSGGFGSGNVINHAYSTSKSASVTFHAVAGVTYSISVGNTYSQTGNFTLNWVPGPANDDYTAAQIVSGRSAFVSATTTGSSSESGEYYYGDGSTVWYRWTAPGSGGVTFSTTGADFDNVVTVYSGGFGSGNVINHAYSTSKSASVTFHAVAGVTYSISVGNTYSQTGNFTLNWVPGPANDDYTAAQIVSGRSAFVSATTTGSSSESGEYYYGDGSTVWYRWTAPGSGGVTFSTTGADFDNVVTVYSGGFGSGNVINHAYSTSKSASVTFHAVAGVTYSISVGNTYSQTGNFIFYGGLSPANDDFVNAQAIYGTAGQVQGVNLPATSEPGEPNHAGEIGGKSIWYRWTAPGSGSVTFDSSKSNFSTLLAVYTGPDVAHLTPVGSNVYDGAINLEKTTLTVGAGITYFIAVDGFSGTTGQVLLNWTAPALTGQGTTHVLWNNYDGTASIWNYGTADGSFSYQNYGPYPGWTAKAIAEGGTDGKLRVLWVNTSGKASLWSLDNTTGTFVSHDFGPYSGWYASSLSVGADNTTHVLWNNYNGTASLWNYDAVGGNYTYKNYGPYSHWAATAVADGKTGNTRLLWANVDGQASLWSLDNTTGSFVSHNFGPYNGWTVSTLSVGADDTTHVSWVNYNGALSLWNYDAIGGNYSFSNYGPYSGWTAKTIADGANGKTRVLWVNTDGTLSLGNLDNATGTYDYHNFGPYNGWTATGLSAGQ